MALVVRQGHFLLTSRDPARPGGGTWELPGGKLEAGEPAEDALRRELAEELGLSGGRLTAYPAYAYRDAHYAVRLYPFRCADFAEGPVGREGQALRWASADDLLAAAVTMPAANAGLLAHLQDHGALAVD